MLRRKKILDLKAIKGLIVFLLVLSFILYIIPVASNGEKFYYIQYRMFEFLLGGIVGLGFNSKNSHLMPQRSFQIAAFCIIVAVVFSSLLVFNVNDIGAAIRKIGPKDTIENSLIMSKTLLLILTVIFTAFFIGYGSPKTIRNSVLEYLGKRSYSLFIWHQMMIAFYRYFVSNKVTLVSVVLFFGVLLLLSEMTYRYVENKVGVTKRSFLITAFISLCVIMSGGYVYVRAGVVRNVPELDISLNHVRRGMHAEYVDRVYEYDKDFPKEDSEKVNVLVVGNSFARDMVNVILESSYKDSVNISYAFDWNQIVIDRARRADCILVFIENTDVPETVSKNKKETCELYYIGTKNYGQSNGIIYSKRFASDYYEQTVELHPWYKKLNEKWKDEWGDHYIDFIQFVRTDNGQIRIFTDDNKYISQDCYHLTQAGARWYAKQIDFTKILKK